ncbi:MAG TPA: M56 family metallopeptidase [Xanthobacteraceae bacterium]|nr:M56 family metallopeptidase [Xanthobacteraceae bacterium]
MILALLAESALRSLLLGGVVWAGLKFLRVRNPHVQMTAWTLVLMASLAMPGLMRLVTVTIADAPSSPLAEILWPAPAASPQMPAPAPAQMPLSAVSAPEAALLATAPRATTDAVDRPLDWPRIDWQLAATAVYAAVGGALLLRLVIGVVLTWRLARAARPIRAGWTEGTDVRVSDVVGVPVTFGATILLPTEYVAWSPAKRRAVLTHERAHVAHGDFYVLLLAALNRAVFWFNPFAWWQLVRLAELAEIISDDAAVEALADRPRYAGILLDLARRVQRAPAGLAMARPCTVRQRVERILAARALPARVDWRARLLVASALVPAVALASVTIARGTPPVEPAPAATTAPSPARGDPSLARYVGFYQAGPRSVLTIVPDGDGLAAQLTGQPRFTLTRASDADYVSAAPPARVSFVTEADQPASALVMHQNDREWRAARVDAATAGAIEAAFARRIAVAPDRFRAQAPTPGSRDALLRAIAEWREGAPDYARMSPHLGDVVRKQLPQLTAMLVALGPVQSVFFRGVGPGGYDIYGAQFANGTANFRLSLAADGTTDDILFHPSGDDTPGDVIACTQEPIIKPGAGTVPIRLLLLNATGADVKLFSLDAEGQRRPHATIGEDHAYNFSTRVGRPLIITDAAGQCLEIVLPGLRTRFVFVQPARVGEPLGWAAPARVAPRPGSEEALRQYIDAVGRGRPNYAQMAEPLAAWTREQLLLHQAILARLGPVRAMSFRGAGTLDADMYTVQFANGSAEWHIRLAKDGRISGIAFGPQY